MSQPTWPKNSSRAEEDMGNKKKNSGPPLLGSSPPMLFVPSILGEEAIKEDPASLESNKEQGEGAVLEGREVSYLCSLPEGGCERDFLLKKIEKAALRLSRQIPLEEDVKGRKLLPLDESIETILATKKTLLIKALGEEKGPYLFEENGCRAAIFEARGNYRKEMQVHSLSSTLELKDKCPCFAIFDGFKGGQVAITLQENFVPYLQEKLRQLEEAQGKKLKEIEASLVENTLTLACVSYNEELRQKGVNGGATMVLGIIVDSVVWCVNIGSSRILSIRDHFVKQLTEDASLDAERFAKSVVKRGGQITCDRSGLWQLGEKVFVARAFGDFSTKGLTARPKITLSSLEQTKALFFGCSGIFESATAQQIGEYIGQRFQEPSHLEPMVREIGRYAAAAGSVGNLCALAVDVTSLAKR
jgi:serine/threonine protein phosphatase PrpC